MKQKQTKKVTLLTFFLIIAVIALGVLVFNQWDKNSELITEIDRLKNHLELEQEDSLLYDETLKFINLLNHGKHASMVTGDLKEELEAQLEEDPKENHGMNLVEKTEINNVYAVKTGSDTGESYGIFRVYYGMDSSVETPITQQQILSLTIHLKWIKKDGFYKVYDYEVGFLKDTMDDYIEELSELDQKNDEGGEQTLE